MSASFFVDGPDSSQVDEAVALARAWAVQVTDPPTTVDGNEYSAKQHAIWAQQNIDGQTLTQHADVQVTNMADGDRLVWSASQGLWVNRAFASSENYISDLDDVDAANAQPDDVLVFDGSQWVNQPLSGLLDKEETLIIAASDEVTPITAGLKLTFRMPFLMALTEVRASLSTAQTSGTQFGVDVRVDGNTVHHASPGVPRPILLDNGEKSSTTALHQVVVNPDLNALFDDSEVTIWVTQLGDGTAKGLKVTLKGIR